MSLAGAIAPFTQRCQVGIVAQPDRHMKALLQNLSQGKLFPPGNIGRRVDNAQLRVDPARSGHANAHTRDHSAGHSSAIKLDQALQCGLIFTLGWDAFLLDGTMFTLGIDGNAYLSSTDVNCDISCPYKRDYSMKLELTSGIVDVFEKRLL